LNHSGKKILDIVKEHGGIQLDVGCGGNKQQGFVGIDVRPIEGVDIVHDLNLFPWPLPDDCVLRAVASHLMEHIPPFGTDPKLIRLVQYLIAKGVIEKDEIGVWLGDWDDATPGFIRFMNELWRVMKVDGQVAISVPHATSVGFPQDPTHINMINEATWSYFDPEEPNTQGLLWQIYKPQPWRLEYLSWNPAGNIEVLLRKREAIEDVK
jgi:hypothetical protein